MFSSNILHIYWGLLSRWPYHEIDKVCTEGQALIYDKWYIFMNVDHGDLFQIEANHHDQYSWMSNIQYLKKCQAKSWICFYMEKMLRVHLSDAETGMFWESYISTMVVDPLVPFITRSSAALQLTTWDKGLIVYLGGGFQLPATFHC